MPAFVSADTAWRTMTRNDPQTNILRATIATFAAGIGGADAVTVLPHTAAHGLPDSFSRRIARNTQLVLIEEANLARVNAPMTGSGWHSDLVDKFAHAAWSQFQEIEKAGGAAVALQRGLIQDNIMAARAALERDMATRRITLVGANDYANLNEASVLNAREQASVTFRPRPFQISRAAPMRLAQPFEVLRDASDRMLAASGKRPKIFLASLGAAVDFSVRATIAKTFFAIGGIETTNAEEFADTDELVQHFAKSGTKFACLCGSDRAYGRDGVGAAKALCDAGATHLYLAGRPKELEPNPVHDLDKAGVGTFVYAGCDVLATLQEAHHRFGIT
jgi:methylmalonyl-CoA mutase